MAELDEKVAVVTGGTRGIGYSVAEALLAEGARVFLCGRDSKQLKESLASLGKVGRAGSGDGRVDGMVADVRRYEDCRKLIRGAVDHFDGIDVLVNNAGIGIMKPVDQLTAEEWDATIGTNLSGAFYCTREAVPLLRQRGGGYIFNISSLAGVNAFAGGSAYNASKFGLNGFSEAIMQDLRYDNIRVSYVMPGSVATEFSSMFGTKGQDSWKLTGEDVARAVIDLLKFPSRALASRIELRPSQPPRKK